MPASYLAANFAPIPNLDREIRADAPIAYWPMTEASGNFTDAIYGGRAFVPSGTLEYESAQLGSGTSIGPSFTTPSTYAKTADNPVGPEVFTGGDFTIEGLYQMRAIPVATSLRHYVCFVGKRGATGSASADNVIASVYVDGAGVVWGESGYANLLTPSQVASAWPIPPGSTAHIAVTYSYSEVLMRIYVNGALAAVGPWFSPGGGENSSLTVGYVKTGGHIAAFGYLAIYDKRLTPARIVAHAVNLARA